MRLSFFIFVLLFAADGLWALSVNSKDIIGTWKLDEIVRITAEGKEIPWCKDVHGLLTYTNGGFMSASINCGEATASDAPSRAYGNMLLYAGTYSISKAGVVTHHLMNSSHLPILGKDLFRTISKFDGKILVLDGKSANQTGDVRVVWSRIKSLNK